MKKNINLINAAQVVGLMMFATACQKTQFVAVEGQSQASLAVPMDPVEPEAPPVVVTPPVTPPVVKPQPVLTKGACLANSSTVLTSCQNCVVPLNPPAAPQFSQKGQSLIDIMAIGCSIPNKSAPKNYVPPTHDELVQRLNRLSPTLYPDSAMTSFQTETISRLKSDPALQNKMFAGLWYQPPYSDAFETYFGVEVGEIVYNICYQNPASIFTETNTTPLVSMALRECMMNSSGCRETPTYIAANTYRNQLRDGMRQSKSNPYIPPAPTPSKTCAWEKFDGLYEMGGAEQMGQWLVLGQKVSLEIKGAGGRCAVATKVPTGNDIPKGEVVMAAYICK